MRSLIRLTILTLFVFAVSVPTAAQQNEDLTGSYQYRFAWGGMRLTLKSNGTFIEASSNCTSVITSSGPYSISHNVLELTTNKLTQRSFDERKEHDITKRQERKKLLKTDEPFSPERTRLEIVRWSDRIYLMHPELLARFVDAINLGFEPRAVDGYLHSYGAILLREGDENKPVTGQPLLPPNLLDRLLSAPVTANVSQLETAENGMIATIDRGSNDGLREEMSMTGVDPDPFYFESFWIISVAPGSAKVKVFGNVKIGDRLTTRLSDVSRFSP